jgi:hypothetical protein
VAAKATDSATATSDEVAMVTIALKQTKKPGQKRRHCFFLTFCLQISVDLFLTSSR